MKRVLLCVILLLALLDLTGFREANLSGLAHAQSGGGPSAALGAGYDLIWWTVDNGGGTSVGVGSPGVGQPNSYTLIGTIGQPDAGLLAGSGYTLVGGFWSGAVSAYTVYLPVVLKQ